MVRRFRRSRWQLPLILVLAAGSARVEVEAVISGTRVASKHVDVNPLSMCLRGLC